MKSFNSFVVEKDFYQPGLIKVSVESRSDSKTIARNCALHAVEKISGEKISVLEKAKNGAPIWPASVVGSITHSKDYAAAVVGSSQKFRSLGIDAENIVDIERARKIQRKILVDAEREVLKNENDYAKFVTLIFSAKESIFKMLNPLTQKIFWFGAAEIQKINRESGVLEFQLKESLSDEFCVGFKGKIFFKEFEKRIETFCFLKA